MTTLQFYRELMENLDNLSQGWSTIEIVQENIETLLEVAKENGLEVKVDPKLLADAEEEYENQPSSYLAGC